MNFVIFVNGLLLVAMAALMAVDGLFFPATETLFMESAVLTGTVGVSICLASATRLEQLHRLHTFLLTASVWVTGAAAGAFPLWMWNMTPTDAFFEAMSGITTTGSTTLTGLDRTPQGILLWRALLQGLGGIGFIVTGIALLPILRVGGMQLFRTESSERGDKEMTSASRFALATVWIYLGLIVLCFMVYLGGGMTGFEALIHALATISTGGYSTSDASFGYFDSAFLEWSGTVFMLAAALPFAWYIRIVHRKPFGNEQVQALVTSLIVVIAALTAWRVITGEVPVLQALRHVAFNVVSVVTTTGFATADYTSWGPLAAVVFFILTAIGGCTGSTAGGAKVMRWIIFVRFLVSQIRTIHKPHGIFIPRYEGRPVSLDVMNGVITYFVFYAATVFFLAVSLAFFGLGYETSLSGALTAVANVGPGIGRVIGPAGNFSSLPDGAKWLLSFGMYAGRLEMLTIFVLMAPGLWREIA
ncbi:TrkH family potassium uptake protein [Brevirhabdus sp.]|uniref:TrkH family potassium uptake protein n=1 Tax=Brevirhabdus sp. TaxID=2004514 RepID=UPI00405878F1